MRMDAHIHIMPGPVEQDRLLREMALAGMDGGCLISEGPSAKATPAERLERLMAWTKGAESLHPLFWIDPVAGSALEQVEQAVAAGVAGFKVICSAHAPGDPQALATFKAIADRNKPILFHSGILWDGRPSSENNRPAAFEALLEVPGLRFSLAHMSWPWIDECVAVYGKFLNSLLYRETAPEMFVDMTPGTPEIYRAEALTKFFTVGYDVADNMIFGSDCVTTGYNVKWVREWQERDEAIMGRLGIGPEGCARVFGGNILRWLSGAKKDRKAPRMGV